MKKFFSLIGATALALVMSFGFPVQQTFASSAPASVVEKIEEVSPYAARRYVTHSVVLNGKVIPDQRYMFTDNHGYRGYIYLSNYLYDSGLRKTTATYAGTVYCIANNCPSTSSIDE